MTVYELFIFITMTLQHLNLGHGGAVVLLPRPVAPYINMV